MLLTMALMLAFASCFIEVKMVSAWPRLERAYLYGIGPISGVWVNNGASLILSWLLGIVFGAQGVSMAIGGIISIPMSNAWFMGKKLANDRDITVSSVKSSFISRSQNATEWWALNSHYFVDLAKTIMVLIKVITWPLRATLKANSVFQEKRVVVASRINEGREKLSHGSTF